MTHADSMTALYNANGKTIAIDGEAFTVKRTRMTYGAGLALTLDRPLAGKSSRLFTISANDECMSVKVAKTIS